jgi:hypothetical protein
LLLLFVICDTNWYYNSVTVLTLLDTHTFIHIIIPFLSSFSSQIISRNNNKNKIPAFDYRSGKGGVPYAGDFRGVIYEYKVVSHASQPSAPLSGPPAHVDVRPDGQRFHDGVVQTKNVYWH